ncbi:MAG: hypothetical protein ABI534_06665 [Chloroflexota bacterium]
MRTLVAVGILLTACASTPAATPRPSASADHAAHDPALDALKAELEAFGLTFEPAGPHHVLGAGASGIEVDLVGIPLEEAVLSIPAAEPDAVRESAEPYLEPIERVLEAPAALDGWLGEQLAAWNGTSELHAEDTFGDLRARLRSTADPAYVVLTLTRG